MNPDDTVLQVLQTSTFSRWMRRLRDKRALVIINVRLTRFQAGDLGDYRSVGDGVFEARIHYGPGYRIYFMREGARVILLLCGGDKGSQRRDIRRALRLARDRREEMRHG